MEEWYARDLGGGDVRCRTREVPRYVAEMGGCDEAGWEGNNGICDAITFRKCDHLIVTQDLDLSIYIVPTTQNFILSKILVRL
jgi:hypothetical protein